MISLLPLLLVPLLVIFVGRKVYGLEHTVTSKEIVVLQVGMVLLLTLGFQMARWSAMTDYEVWGGRVDEKTHGTQGCCHCHSVCSGSGKTRSCHTVCSHSHDQWWGVHLTSGDSVEYEGCASPISSPPALWTNTQIGDPGAVLHSYTNYFLADPDSLFADTPTDDEAAEEAFPAENLDVYREIKIDRAVFIDRNGKASPLPVWSKALLELNADLGPAKGVSVAVVITDAPDRSFAKLVDRKWLHGKRNDAIFVLGSPQPGGPVTWSEVLTTPSGNTFLRSHGRDAFVGLLTDDVGYGMDQIRSLIATDWKWSGIEDFAYLATAAQPTWLGIVFLYVLAILGSAGGLAFMDKHDLFGDEFPSFDRYARNLRGPRRPRPY